MTISHPTRAALNTASTVTKVASVVLAVISGALIAGLWAVAGLHLEWLAITVLTGWVAWLHWDRATVHDKVDRATDDADRATGRVEAVENHLTGIEPAGSGRHAHSSGGQQPCSTTPNSTAPTSTPRTPRSSKLSLSSS